MSYDFTQFLTDHIFELDAKLFVLLVELQSFSEVARISGRSQSSVSKRIFELESKLGVTLFDRDRRPIRTTQEGRALYYEIKRHSDALTETIQRLKSQNSLKPSIRLGCIESLSLDLIPQLIQRLLPVTSKISQITTTSNTLVRLLLEHKLDLIISSDPFNEVKGLHRRFLFNEPSIVLMSKKMAEKRKDWSWFDLQTCGKPYIYYHLESGGGRLNETYLSSQYLTLPNQLEVDSNTVMVSLIRDDVGWTISRPSTLMQTKEFVAGVMGVPMPPPILSRQIYLIARVSEDKGIVDTCYTAIMDILIDVVQPALYAIAPWASRFLTFSREGQEEGSSCGINSYSGADYKEH